MNGEISGASAAPKCIRSDLGSEEIISRLKTLHSKSRLKDDFKSLKNEQLLDSGVGLVLWFIKVKKKKAPAGYHEFYLGSRFAEWLCPRRHGEKLVTEYLKEAGIITVTKAGFKGYSVTYYKLNDGWSSFIPSNFKLNEWQSKRLALALDNAREAQYELRPWLKWVDKTLELTTLPETQELREALRNPDTKPSATRAMNFLRGYLAPHQRKFSKAKYCGTIYTPIFSMPKEVVKTLKINGEKVAQLDITAAHPSTIPLILIEGENKFGIAGGIEEADRLRESLESGELYKLLASACHKSIKEVKKQFLSALNGKNCHIYNDQSFKAFCELFPIAKSVLSQVRKGGSRLLNQKMATPLSKAVDKTIKTCQKYGIYCFPRTDEIVCRKSDANFVREVLAAYFFDETGVNALVGNQRVSFIPDEEIVWSQFCEKYKIGINSTRTSQKIEDDLPLWRFMRPN
jgi:hypothetical protein